MHLDDLPDVITEFGPDLRVRFANAAFLEMARDMAPAVIGSRLADLGFGAPFAEPIEDAIRECIASGAPGLLEVGVDVPIGHRHLEIRFVPRRDTDGEPSALVLAQDVTDRYRAREELEATASAVAGYLPGFLFRLGCTGPSIDEMTLEYVGPGIGPLLGYLPSDLPTPCPAAPFLDPTDLAALARLAVAIGSVMATGEPDSATIECRLMGRDGTPVWMRGARAPGPAAGVSGTGADRRGGGGVPQGVDPHPPAARVRRAIEDAHGVGGPLLTRPRHDRAPRRRHPAGGHDRDRPCSRAAASRSTWSCSTAANHGMSTPVAAIGAPPPSCGSTRRSTSSRPAGTMTARWPRWNGWPGRT